MSGPELRETIDELLADCLVVEVWLAPLQRRQVAHRFVRVEHWPEDWDGYELLQVRGHPAVIENLGLTARQEWE